LWRRRRVYYKKRSRYQCCVCSMVGCLAGSNEEHPPHLPWPLAPHSCVLILKILCVCSVCFYSFFGSTVPKFRPFPVFFFGSPNITKPLKQRKGRTKKKKCLAPKLFILSFLFFVLLNKNNPKQQHRHLLLVWCDFFPKH